MHAHAGMPCHHPKWPVQCPKCQKPADGVSVTVPIDRRWDPDSQEMRTWAWGTAGMACFRCNKAIVCAPEKDAPVSEQYIRELIKADIPGLLEVDFIDAALFNRACRLPAEEPEKEEVSKELAKR